MDKNRDQTYYSWKARIFVSRSHVDKAVVLCKRRISLDPKSYDQHFTWAHLRNQQKEYHLAESKFREVTILNPKDPTAWNELGICFDQNDKYDQAIAAYKKGLEITTNMDLLHNLAISLTKKGDYENASEWLTKALNWSPSNERINNSIGYLDLLQGKYEVAILQFNNVIHKSPRYSTSFLNKAIALLCWNGGEEEPKEVFWEGILAITEQKRERLRDYVRNYNNELKRVMRDLVMVESGPKVASERKIHLEKLRRSLEYILDLLKIEIENFEKNGVLVPQ